MEGRLVEVQKAALRPGTGKELADGTHVALIRDQRSQLEDQIETERGSHLKSLDRKADEIQASRRVRPRERSAPRRRKARSARRMSASRRSRSGSRGPRNGSGRRGDRLSRNEASDDRRTRRRRTSECQRELRDGNGRARQLPWTPNLRESGYSSAERSQGGGGADRRPGAASDHGGTGAATRSWIALKSAPSGKVARTVSGCRGGGVLRRFRRGASTRVARARLNATRARFHDSWMIFWLRRAQSPASVRWTTEIERLGEHRTQKSARTRIGSSRP